MPNIVHIQSNFTAGEISPRLFGRVDLSKYNNGAKTIENALVQTHGGLSRRPGTRFCAELKSDAVHTYTETIDTVVTTFSCTPRLVEFHYNTEQSYVLEIGVTSAVLDTEAHGYMRFNRLVNNVPTQLESAADTPTQLINLPINAKELTQLKFTQSADTMFMFCPTRSIKKITRTGIDTDPDSWELTDHTTIDGPYLNMNTDDVSLSIDSAQTPVGGDATISGWVTGAGNTKAYPFKASDIGRCIRLEDAVKGYATSHFERGSSGDTGAAAKVWVKNTGENPTFASVCYNKKNPMVEFYNVREGAAMLDGTLHMAKDVVTDGAYTRFGLLHAGTGQREAYDDFVDGNVSSDQMDGFVRLKPSDFCGWGVISGDPTGPDGNGNFHSAPITVKSDFISNENTPNWRLGAWSDETGYPQNGTFHQNRLWCAATTEQPQTLWASEVNAYDVFSPSEIDTAQVTDSTALALTLASRHVNAINHMKSDGQGLMVFTSGGEWLGRAANPSAPITATDVSFQKQSSYGSVFGVEPVRLGTAYLLFQRDRATLREYTYEFGQDRFVAPNITIMAEHITKNGVTDGTFQMGATPRLWCVTDTGELLCLTYDKEQAVVAWSRMIMGKSGTTPTPGVVLSCARTTDGDDDNVWILVKRVIGTTEKYFIETLAQDFEVTDTHAQAYFVDCGLSGYSEDGATTWTGLDHLNGQAVYALVDGVQYGPFTVAAIEDEFGITTVSANNVQVGLLYNTIVETVPLNVQQSLESRGRRKRIYTSFFSMYRSLSGQAGTPEQVYNLEYPTATTSPPPLNTGLFEMSIPDNSDREMIVRYEQEDVHPSNLLAITSEIHLGV